MGLPTAPRARSVPLVHERFGIRWPDGWAWLRDPAYPTVEEPEILAYLQAENAYHDAVLAPDRARIEALHEELVGRLEADDESVPVRDGPYAYRWRFAPGQQYRSWWRRPLDGAAETLLLDENDLAAGSDFFNLRALEVDPSGALVAFSTDRDGSERYRLTIRELSTGGDLDHAVSNISGSVVWAEDGRTLFYVELNESLRPFRVRAHRLGAAASEDRVVYEETDPAYFVAIGKTRDRSFIVVATGTHVSNELRLIDARAADGPPRLVAERREGHRYTLDHAHGRLWIRTNDRHENFRLVSAPAATPDEDRWHETLAGDSHHYLLGVSCFAEFLVLTERVDGLARLRLRFYDGAERTVAFEEDVYTALLGDNREFAADTLRIAYSSMVTPHSVLDYEVASGRITPRKVQRIPSGYDSGNYRTQRLMAPAPDGAMVPVTLLHRVDFPRDGSGPLMLSGYGAYGSGLDPAFSPHRLSLVDRGFCVALAHVRGGDEMGWRWYEDGKLANKANSFTDFIAVAEHLIAERWCAAGRIAIRGGSAGGMLIGAVCNLRPGLWGCAVLEVPFVDVLNTMLDPSLPLTPIEWPEWGNPLEDEAAFRRILAYSPYDNIAERRYPPMLVTAGIADPRVTYWEPAKYVARMRATRSDTNLLLLKTNMGAGHFGKSGRYDMLEDLAEQYAFVLRCLGHREETA